VSNEREEVEDHAKTTDAGDVDGAQVVIITGMSGSGKSTAMRALEDAGFFCIDNLPVPLLPRVLDLTASRTTHQHKHYAFVVDTRERNFLPQADEIIDQLSADGVSVKIIFLEADEDTLVRRYSETRRRHPLSGPAGTVRDGIADERELLQHLRDRAAVIINSSEHTVHTLKARILELVVEGPRDALKVTLLSFGFKYGLPTECDLVFDVRFLPNPYFVEELRPKTGLEKEVSDYVLGAPNAKQFVEHFMNMVTFALPLYRDEGKTYLTIGIGCTGGKHRSVAISELVSGMLREEGFFVQTRHRDRLNAYKELEARSSS